MTTQNQNPIYNLKVVLKETGLKPDVLRAWERRYDLPKPQRSKGGHRLYSDHDIAVIKWLIKRQAEGLSISHAVDLWNELSEAGRNPFDEYGNRSQASLLSPQIADTRIEIWRNRWLDACLGFDTNRAESVLQEAFALYPVETVCFEILQRSLLEVGTLWYEGKITVQQEHFISALSIQRLETVVSALPAGYKGKTILLGCPAGEWHTFPILLLKLLLARRGWDVVYLGANNPNSQLVATAQEIKPALVILGAQHLISAASLKLIAQQLKNLGIPLAYGGKVFNRIPELRQKIAAVFLGETLEEGLAAVDQLVDDPAAFSVPETIEDANHEISQEFRRNRALIENGVFVQINHDGLATDYLLEANNYFGSGLEAALEFGDPAYMEADLEWVRKLLTDRHISIATLHPYMMAYSHSTRINLGETGAQIANWMDGYISKNKPAVEYGMENDKNDQDD